MKYIHQISYDFDSKTTSVFQSTINVPFPVNSLKITQLTYNNNGTAEDETYLLATNLPHGLTNSDVLGSFLQTDNAWSPPNTTWEYPTPSNIRGTYDFYVKNVNGSLVVPTSGTPDILYGKLFVTIEFQSVEV